MNIVILRRRKLGHGSCTAIVAKSQSNVKLLRNDKVPIGMEKPDLLVRWGCTSQLDSKKTLNKSDAINLTNNKLESRKLLHNKNISVPKTSQNLMDIQYPLVVRPVNHSQGKQFYYCENIVDATQAINKITSLGKAYYISEFIPKVKEYGVFVFNNRVTSMIEKVPKNEAAKEAYAWNVAQGSHTFENVNWDNWHIPSCLESLRAVQELGLDFGRVDVIVDSNGKVYVLEVNSAHSLTSDYRQEVFAKCLDYYVGNGPVKEELKFDNIKSYKSIIHPALRVNAQGLNL
jgi:carbamoylphosphate synthase large subunit